MFLNIGTLKNINVPFGTNGKLMALGVPILKHFYLPQEQSSSKHIKREGDHPKPTSSGDANPAKLKESADMVVKYLTPYFKDGKIASKVSS